jgi:hypothetical protein
MPAQPQVPEALNIRLGLRDNWLQFSLLILINAFVGGMAVEALELRLDAGDRSFLEAPYRPRDEINDQNSVRRPRALHPG